MFLSSAWDLKNLNADILGDDETLIYGQEIKIPRPAAYKIAPSPCAENIFYTCYTVVANDTIWNIGG